MKTWNRIFVAISLMFFAQQQASAQIVYEPFNYSSGLILGQNGGSGWAGSWTFLPSWQVGSPGLTFGSLTTQGNLAQFSAAAGGAENRRSFATPFLNTGGDVWFSFLTRPDDASFGNAFNGLTLLAGVGSTDGRSLFVGKTSIGNSPYGMATFPSIGFVPTDVSPIQGDTVFLVGRIQFAAGNDTVTLWANPTPGLANPDSTAFMKTDYDFGASVDAAYIFGGSSDWSTDEIRFGDSFASVSLAVPEPSALALIGCASVVGRWMYRRRIKSRAA